MADRKDASEGGAAGHSRRGSSVGCVLACKRGLISLQIDSPRSLKSAMIYTQNARRNRDQISSRRDFQAGMFANEFETMVGRKIKGD